MKRAGLGLALVVVSASFGCGDDDNHTFIDANGMDGTGADAPPSTSCTAPRPLDENGTASGDTTGETNQIDGQCSIDFNGGGGRETVFQVTPTMTGEML